MLQMVEETTREREEGRTIKDLLSGLSHPTVVGMEATRIQEDFLDLPTPIITEEPKPETEGELHNTVYGQG